MWHKGIGMGLFLMSERELQRIEVLAQVLDGSLRSATAASLLGLSQRQVQRLLGKVRDKAPCWYATGCAADPRTTAAALSSATTSCP